MVLEKRKRLEVPILFDLFRNEIITARELSNRYEVSTRTIYRTVEALIFLGVPVQSKKGKYGGLYLTKDYIRQWGGVINARIAKQ